MQIATEDGAHIAAEPQRVEEGQQVEQGRVGRVGKPGLDGYGVVRVAFVRTGRVVQYEYLRQVVANGRQIFSVAANI